MRYKYCIRQTMGTVGFAACEPEEQHPLEQLLRLFAKTPNDNFLRRHLLERLEKLSDKELSGLGDMARNSSVISSLLSAVRPDITKRETGCPPFNPQKRVWNTPAARQLRAAVRDNLTRLQKIPSSALAGLAEMPNYAEIVGAGGKMLQNAQKLEEFYRQRQPLAKPAEEVDIAPILNLAVQALERADLLAGPEMRHEKSLSPIGLLRDWHLKAGTVDGEQKSELYGIATAYGRGLDIARARVSLAMEIVERASAHVEIFERDNFLQVAGRSMPIALVPATLAELEARGEATAFPETSYPLESWRNLRLQWAPAEDKAGKRVLVPAQAVFLFCNLAEPMLFEDQGSTGLAAGSTRAQARLGALLEVVERDAAATTPFYAAACFRLRSRDKRIQGLLDDYANQGIDVRFQDITSEAGAPAYRCYVLTRQGEARQGTAAALDSKKAVISALTETPWNYAYGRGEAGMPPLGRLPNVWLEDLPDFSLGTPEQDLKLLEDVLEAQGIFPAYVDITRRDLALPVCRAIVPQLEICAGAEEVGLSMRLLARLEILARSGLL